MNYTFDIVIPTYQRFNKLVRCIKSIPDDSNITVYIYFDNRDMETYAKVKAEFPNRFLSFTVMERKSQAFGIWNFHAQSCSADIMVYLCDDTELLPETLSNVEKHFEEKFPDTDGVVTFYQTNIKGSDSAMGCIGRKFIERYPNGEVFNPNYVSFYADTDVGDYAKKLSKFHFGTDCGIIHYHPVSGEPMDSTHHVIRGKDKTIDMKINKIRKAKGILYPIDLEIIDRSQFDV